MAESTPTVANSIVVEEQMVFSLQALCRASGGNRVQVLTLVDEGLLDPQGDDPDSWRFGGASLGLVRRTLTLSRDLELDLSAAAIVASLLAELARLRAQLRVTVQIAEPSVRHRTDTPAPPT